MDVLGDPAAWVATLPPILIPLLVFVSSALEYIFPPYWGDTLILLGFFLVGQGVASGPQIFIAAVAGGMLGSFVAYLLGARYGLRAVRRFLPHRRRVGSRARIDQIFARFGERSLLLNRFLPVVRGLMLYGAGAMDLRLRPVLIYASIGNLAWVSLLMAVGLLTGGTWEQIQQTFQRSSGVLAVVAVVVVVVGGLGLWWRRRRGRSTQSPDAETEAGE